MLERTIKGRPMPRSPRRTPLRPKVLALVSAIPRGHVTTYGALARRLGVSARQVAYVLARLTMEESERLSWYRVVAAGGVVSTMRLGAVGRKQVRCLAAEGIAVTAWNKIDDFRAVEWAPTGPALPSETFNSCSPSVATVAVDFCRQLRI